MKEHGAWHLASTTLDVNDVEFSIAWAVQDTIRDQAPGTVGEFWGRVHVEGQLIEFRAFPIDDQAISVGTYYLVAPQDA